MLDLTWNMNNVDIAYVERVAFSGKHIPDLQTEACDLWLLLPS